MFVASASAATTAVASAIALEGVMFVLVMFLELVSEAT